MLIAIIALLGVVPVYTLIIALLALLGVFNK